jgi:hypothetical protein
MIRSPNEPKKSTDMNNNSIRTFIAMICRLCIHYLHRYSRLIVPYTFVLIFAFCVFNDIGRGPAWHSTTLWGMKNVNQKQRMTNLQALNVRLAMIYGAIYYSFQIGFT